MINLSTKNTTYGSSIIPTIHFEPPKGDNLSIKKKSAEFELPPKCPLFRVSPVHVCTVHRFACYIVCTYVYHIGLILDPDLNLELDLELVPDYLIVFESINVVR